MRTSWQSIVAFLVGASIALIVAWASADAAFAQSKKSKSRVENQPSQSSQQDGTKQQLPAQQPPIVNVQPIEKTDAERAEEAEDRRRKATLDALLTQYTGKLAQFTEWLFIATVGLAAATIGLLVAGVFQVYHAKRATEIATQTLTAAQRPWVGQHRHRVLGPLVHNVNGANIRIGYIAKNFGNTAALFAEPELKIFLGYGAFDIQAEMKKFSDECRERAAHIPIDQRRHGGVFIFPNTVWPMHVGTNISAAQWSEAEKNRAFAVYLFSIVQYLSPVDERWHQTGMILEFRNRAGEFHRPDPSGESSIPQANLFVRPYWVGNFAD